MSRLARCLCGRTEPASKDLAFFVYRGPNSEYAKKVCEVCGCYETAHIPSIQSRRGSLVCSQFKRGTGHEYDTYYCGCRGWD